MEYLFIVHDLEFGHTTDLRYSLSWEEALAKYNEYTLDEFDLWIHHRFIIKENTLDQPGDNFGYY